jgi:hypothetical protein
VTGRLPLILAAAFAACKPDASASPIDGVGDPLGDWRTSPSEAFARNLWDLQDFRGRLYLGYGDAIVNTGPTQVLAFDPASQAFTQDTVVNEEAISSLRVFGDRLYVPGPDAVESPDGALYVRDATGWTTITLPGVVHACDVLVHGDELCVAVQDDFNGGAVRCSHDDGATWSTYRTGGFRSVSLFELGDALYVSSHDVGVQRIDGRVAPVNFELEGIEPRADVLVTRAVHCGGELVFIAKQVTYSRPPDVQVFGLFHTPDIATSTIAAKHVAMRGTPADLFARDGLCYAVTNQPKDAGGYDVAIERSKDGRSWHRSATFASDAMVRSAELMDGHFYLGTGCELGHCSAEAGRLLRVRAPVR